MTVEDLMRTLSRRPPAARVFIGRSNEQALSLGSVAEADEVEIVNAEGTKIPTGEELVVVLKPEAPDG